MDPYAGKGRTQRLLLPVAAFCLPFLLYLLTACRDIYWMDSTEFMLCGRLLCLSHPPGYPLLTLLLRLVSLIPVLSMPFRMNLVSGLAAAGSCLFVYLTVRRLTADGAAGLFAALAWAVSWELWNQATALEAYALNALLVSAAVYAVVVWTKTGRTGPLLLGSLAFGLGLANHLTVLLWLPGLLVIAWSRPLGGRVLLVCLVFLFVGPLLYLAVPFLARSDILGSWAGIDGMSAFVEFVTARTYQYRLLAAGEGYLARQVAGLPSLFGRQFLASWVMLVPGIVWCLRQNRRFGLAMLSSGLLVTGFATAYNIPDKEGFFLPAYLAGVLVCGVGLNLLRRKHRVAATAAGFALLVLPLGLYYRQQDRHHLRGLRDLCGSLVAELPPGSVLFTDEYSTVQGMRWLALERGSEPVLVVSEHHLAFPWYLEALGRRARVPDQAFELTRRLWQSSARGIEFGERARNATQEVKRLLARAWVADRPLYWMPADFQVWPEAWHEFALKLTGLTYRFVLGQDTVSEPSRLTIPGPGRYRTDRFRDAETQDLCRRFAVAVNRRGIIRFSGGDTEQAIADFNLALAYFPGFPSAIENKGIVFFYAGQPDSARLYLNTFLELTQDKQEILKVRSFLARLDQE